MVKNYEAKIALLGALVALTTALPQPASYAAGVDKVVTSGDPDASAPIDLPFLQFKNGGIRVNFAGYHAEAGLGGLLGGSDAKGGLFASAGTPWGPSASAGLGGTLGGEDGTARGGLHARAGLGNGRPEAAAGLGGALDGSGRSRSRATGGLFAGATAGGPVGAAAGLGGSVGGESGSGTGSAFAGSSDGRKSKVTVKDVSNIQSIAPPKGGDRVYLSKSGPEEAKTTLEFKVPSHDQRKDVSSSIVTRELGNSGTYKEANGVVTATDEHDISNLSYPARRYYRKRLREGKPVRKSFYKFFTTNTVPIAETPVASVSGNVGGGIVERQAIDDRPTAAASGYVPYGSAGGRTKSGTLFDDIFNIPISALTAVNQLLNNKSG